jgi:mono/diheme cytochrome c family protein
VDGSVLLNYCRAWSCSPRAAFLPGLLPAFIVEIIMLRMPWSCFGLAVLGLLWGVAFTANAATPQQEKFFEEQVRPILATHCQKCHGAEKQESELRLDSRDALLRGGATGEPGAVPGEPEKSFLVQAIRHEGDYQMPPRKKLSDAEIETLTAWVKDGLPWPEAAQVKSLTVQERLLDARSSLWSLQPITDPPLPAVKDIAWPSRKLDFYILAKLEAAGLTPSPAADRRTLIRRATFDLHGLPPTPEEVAAFEQDAAPDAYARLIERLLASPRYGERWGRHWLDVARYADTSGYAFQRERRYPYSYTYRDYVINALNNDLPYDQFLLEQLAADLLPSPDDNSRLAALGFLTVGRKFNNRQLDIDDQIDVVGRGLLGLTVACARCHDHKYDPIPQADYYSLYGVFASCNQPDDLPLIGEPKKTEAFQHYQAELEKRQGELNKYLDDRHTALVNEAREKSGEYLAALVSLDPQDLLRRGGISLGKNDLKPQLLERWSNYLKAHAQPEHALLGFWQQVAALQDVDPQPLSERIAPIVAAWLAKQPGIGAGQINPLLKQQLTDKRPGSKAEMAKLYGALLSAVNNEWKSAGANQESRDKLAEPAKQVAELLLADDAAPRVPRAEIDRYLARDERNHAQELKRKIDQHQVNDPGAPPRAMVVRDGSPVNPRVLIRGDANRPGEEVQRQFLVMLEGPDRKPFQEGSGRLEMAQDIIAADNPLTPRVLASRTWMHHFGEPLVATPGDLGVRSEPPTQLAALDYLARYAQAQGWSMKALHREIMLSSTYQQQSSDREDCVAVDPENRLYWKANRRRLEFEALRDSLLAVSGKLNSEMGGRPVEIANAPYAPRRSVYGFIDRQDLPNLFRVFDVASPDVSVDRRVRTTVPQQALYLMNSPPVLEQAQSLAARTEVAAASTPEQKITALYQLLYQRAPTAQDLTIGQQFIQAAQADADAAKLTPWEQYAQLLMLTNEFLFVD